MTTKPIRTRRFIGPGRTRIETQPVNRVARLHGGGPVRDLHLIEAEINEAVSEPFVAHLVCRSLSGNPTPDGLIGREAVVEIPLGSGGPTWRWRSRWFHALIAEASVDHRRADGPRVALELRPALWFLGLTQDCRIFQDQTAIEIVTGLCEQHGVAVDASRLLERCAPRNYCVQYNETTLGFIERLLAEEGVSYFFEHTRQRHTLVLADAPAVYRAHRACARLDHHPAERPVHSHEHAWGLRETTRARPRAFSTTDYNFELPRDELFVTRRESGAPALGRAEIYDFPGEYARHQEGDGIARLRLEQLRRDARRFEFQTSGRAVCAGHQLVLRHASGTLADEDLLVVGVRARVVADHAAAIARSLDTDLARTEGEPAFAASVTAVDARVAVRPPWPRRTVLVDGPQTATVVGPADEEIHTDEHGRVKVRFHWDRENPGDERASCWIRVSEPWAGKGWGGLQIPRVGQEVIVDFLDGDPDRPIITGRLYNGANKPPQTLPAGKMISGMRSKTYGAGGHNEITFDDTDGSQKMYIQAQYDQVVQINNNRSTTVGVDSTEAVGNDLTLQIGNNRTEVIGVNHTTQVGANTTIASGQNIVLQAGTSITLTCGASTLHMNQAGVITLSGTMVTMAGAVNCNVAAPITNIAGAALLTNTGAVNLSTGVVSRVEGTSFAHFGGKTAELVGESETLVQAPCVKIN